MNERSSRIDVLSSFALKCIACLLMTFDHIALFFVSPVQQETLYMILRSIGKISFPLFVYLAVIGCYKTRNVRAYLLRLAVPAVVLDVIGFLVGAIFRIPVATNPLIGNAFTDMFLGVLALTLLRKKNKFSFLAILPVLYAFFSSFPISPSYGTLFKADWGFFSIVLFLAFFAAKELADFFLRYQSLRFGLEPEEILHDKGFFYEKCFMAGGLVFAELAFYLMYRIDNTLFLLPVQFVPIGTYSTLAFVFILLSSQRKGYSSRRIQYAFYAFYPLHLLLLGGLALALGYL